MSITAARIDSVINDLIESVADFKFDGVQSLWGLTQRLMNDAEEMFDEKMGQTKKTAVVTAVRSLIDSNSSSEDLRSALNVAADTVLPYFIDEMARVANESFNWKPSNGDKDDSTTSCCRCI